MRNMVSESDSHLEPNNIWITFFNICNSEVSLSIPEWAPSGVNNPVILAFLMSKAYNEAVDQNVTNTRCPPIVSTGENGQVGKKNVPAAINIHY